MQVSETILKLISAVLGLFATWGLNKVIGKWVAHFIIVWEAEAAKEAREAYATAMQDFKTTSQPNYSKWREIREKWSQPK